MDSSSVPGMGIMDRVQEEASISRTFVTSCGSGRPGGSISPRRLPCLASISVSSCSTTQCIFPRWPPRVDVRRVYQFMLLFGAPWVAEELLILYQLQDHRCLQAKKWRISHARLPNSLQPRSRHSEVGPSGRRALHVFATDFHSNEIVGASVGHAGKR